MMASRGMGDIKASKMPKPKVITKRDGDYPVDVYKKGGWIKDAIKKPGALKKQLGINPKNPIPPKTLAKAAKAPGKLGQRARLAETLKGLK
jgi:hypothetical protein